MRILTIGGNHPRHLFYVNAIRERFPIAGSIIEVRENLLPQAPDGLEEGDRDNFVRHFRNRAMAEEKYFGEQSLTHKLSKISYFGAAQSIIFATLQTGAFALMVHGDDDDDFDFMRSSRPNQRR